MSVDLLYPPASRFSHVSHNSGDEAAFSVERDIARTPSPTPEEASLLRKRGLGNTLDWRHPKKYFDRKYLKKWIIIIFLIIVTVLTSVFSNKIIKSLEPFGRKLKSIPAGWLIPVAMQIVLAYPPLVGRELIQTLCGVVWGLWVGFAIVILATLLGEVAVFFSFRYLCRGRVEKWEKNNLKYGLLGRAVRESGFLIMIMARLGALPPSFTTLVFAVCDCNFYKFILAVILTLPAQFSSVYFGVATRDDADHKGTTAENVANVLIIIFFILMTIVAERYITKKVDEVKPAFIYERRKARQANVIAPIPKAVLSKTYMLERYSSEQLDTFASVSDFDHSSTSHYAPQTVV